MPHPLLLSAPNPYLEQLATSLLNSWLNPFHLFPVNILGAMTKQESLTTEDVGVDTDQDASNIVKEVYRGTSADQHDMDVLGVKQVLRRNYRLVPMLGFSSIAVISCKYHSSPTTDMPDPCSLECSRMYHFRTGSR